MPEPLESSALDISLKLPQLVVEIRLRGSELKIVNGVDRVEFVQIVVFILLEFRTDFIKVLS
jgi:hypothetical protein